MQMGKLIGVGLGGEQLAAVCTLYPATASM